MKITNNVIEEMITVINDTNSFRNDVSIKIPAKVRYAIRVNEDKVASLYKSYQSERAQILRDYVDKGMATIENEKFHIDPDHVSEINNELTELALIENEVEFHTVDKETMDNFLSTVDLSVPEEKILLMFVE